MSNNKSIYGGQAVIEGVMMGGKYTTVTAVRMKNGTIHYYEYVKQPKPSLQKLKKIPFVRGIVGILEASAIGTKHLNFSSAKFEEQDETDSVSSSEVNVWTTEDTQDKKEKTKLGVILGVALLGILSFLFAKFIFTLVPAVAADLLKSIIPGNTGQILLEGLFKILLLFGYIYFVSLTPIMKKVFQYHGAEHKVINTFENDKELTVECVQKHSRLHYRCGSSFILFTAVISILLYFFVPTNPLWLRLIYRIILIPVDLGLAYEVLQLTNKVRHIPILKWLGYPGLWLQLLTTKEPDEHQIEVSIEAFLQMRRREADLKKEIRNPEQKVGSLIN